ncbi:hypothetical protein J4E93_001030 [Alternaria ventricosa]|uniref:uncharacterized protein n=1 Tax=Alternaria ventricosa TaxID=1187951 RepID=UPI0020C2581C|nr:uncharacterized protein J4E93_001030 [Alternaria ventricosa]KAI4656311.1 hypothetical protein J4E93_001030 [Alternaria ventricosa]
MAKTNLDRRFLIELNGQFVSSLSDTETAYLAANWQEKYPVSMGDRDKAAVFTLENGLLLSRNEVSLLVVGRLMDEEDKFDPRPMYWAEQFHRVKSVQYTGDGDDVQLESFDFPLGALLDDDEQTRLYACPPTMDIGPGTKLHWQETKA